MSADELEAQISHIRRQYKRAAKDMARYIKDEIDSVDLPGFEPSEGLDSMILVLIQKGNQLKALLGMRK